MKITLDIKEEKFAISKKQLHNITAYMDNKHFGSAIINLDQMEDLENNLTDLLVQLSRYRLSIQEASDYEDIQ